MTRTRSGVVAVAALLMVGLVVVPGAVGSAGTTSAAEPTHSISVTGSGATLHPAFDPATDRYALRADAGPVTVLATTSDPDGLVRVNGRPVPPGGEIRVDGQEGDEVSVLISDAGGTAAYSLIRLPASFPDMEVIADEPGREPGHVFLTLGDRAGGDRFETVIDHNAVPVHMRRATNSMDLKRQPNGGYSVARAVRTDLSAPFDIVELDGEFQEVASYRTVGLQNTDFHDSLLLPDGSRYLMAYEPNTSSGLIDSVVQHIDASGQLLFEWNSEGHVDPEIDGLTPLRDYAHLNSVELMADGDLLMSFRHTSQVLKVARTAHDGWQAGDVIWRLGGRRSDFTFPDDPYAGPCAQHTARELPNGNIMVFDNGSRVTPTTLEPMCAAPEGDPVERPQSRLVEYTLDEGAGTASVAWSWERPGLFAEFAGSAQRLPAGNTLGGFANSSPDVVEVDPDGKVVWELAILDAFSYRALKFPAPDLIEPDVDVAVPAAGAVYVEGATVPADFACSDRGGANLVACDAPSLPGRAVDTSVIGDHVFEVEATDGAGNTTVISRSYRVLPRWRPDLMLRKKQGAPWRGDAIYGDVRRQSLDVTLGRPGGEKTVWFRIRNDGARPERIRLVGSRDSRAFQVTWRVGKADVTQRLTTAGLRTPRLQPGESLRLRATVRRGAAAETGQVHVVRLAGSSVHQPVRADAVRARLRAG